MAKLSKERDRRAVVEQMRREQRRQERRKSMLVIGIAVLIGAIIVGIAAWQLLKANQETSGPLTAIGVPADQAGCQKLVTKPAQGNSQHRPTGEKILYPDAPPAFGPHWANYLNPNEVRRFFTAED